MRGRSGGKRSRPCRWTRWRGLAALGLSVIREKRAMLVIREKQLEAFRSAANERCAEVIAAHLRQHYPTPCAALGDEEQVRAFVQRGMTRGAKHGIETRGGLTLYLELLVQFGENLECSPLRPWSKNILENPDLPGDVKAGVLRDRHLEITQGRVLVTF